MKVSPCSAFVQVASAHAQSPESTMSVAFTAAQSAGNLNVVAVGVSDGQQDVKEKMDPRFHIELPPVAILVDVLSVDVFED